MRLQIISPNSWDSKRFLILISSAHLAIIGSVAFDYIVNDNASSLIRALIASIFMLTVPGVLVLRILRSHLGPLQAAVYSIGVSLAFTMLLGASLNFLLPILGVEQPLRQGVVLTGFIATTLLLSAIAYFGTRLSKEEESRVEIEIPLVPVSYLLLLVTISILGAIYLNNNGGSSFALLFLVLVSTVPVLVALQKIPASLFPATIAACAVGLLLHKALISQYLTGWDIHVEYFFANRVLENSFWEIGTSSNVNALMSTCILAPSLTEITGIPLTWIFKIVYPILYSLVPVGLYLLLSPMVGRNYAFFSAFFLISTFVFIQIMTDLFRQGVAEIFLVLLMMQLFDANVKERSRPVLSLICIGSLVVSHYGLTYVFALLIMGAWGFLRFRQPKGQSTNPISGRLIAILLGSTYVWYSMATSSSVLNTVIGQGSAMWNGIFTDFLSRQSSQIVNIAVTEFLPMHTVTKYLILLSEALTMAGIWGVLVRKNTYRMPKSFRMYAVSGVALLLICLFVPYFTATMNFGRLFQIGLLGLAPFFVLGFTLAKKERNPLLGARGVVAVAVFLSVFLLFNSGFVYKIAGEPSYISLDSKLDYPRFVSQEVVSADWLSENRNEHIGVYVDDYRWLLLFSMGVNTTSLTGHQGLFPPTAESYCYLGRENVVNNNIVLTNWTIRASPVLKSWPISETEVAAVLSPSDRILDNGASEVFLIQR